MAFPLALTLSHVLVPLQLIDEFLVKYNVGQVLLLVFVLSILGTLPLKSKKIVALNVIVFGLIFTMTPNQVAPVHYRFLGIALLVIGPMVYITATR